MPILKTLFLLGMLLSVTVTASDKQAKTKTKFRRVVGRDQTKGGAELLEELKNRLNIPHEVELPPPVTPQAPAPAAARFRCRLCPNRMVRKTRCGFCHEQFCGDCITNHTRCTKLPWDGKNGCKPDDAAHCSYWHEPCTSEVDRNLTARREKYLRARSRRRLQVLQESFDAAAGPRTVQSSFTPEEWKAMKEQDRLENIEKIKSQGAVPAHTYSGHRRLQFDAAAGPRTVQSSFTPEEWKAMKEQDRLENIEKIKSQGAVNIFETLNGRFNN